MEINPDELDFLATSVAVAHTAYVEKRAPGNDYEAEVFDNCRDICLHERPTTIAEALDRAVDLRLLTRTGRRSLVSWMEVGCPA